ncbi:MAG: HAMP domain-containing sensor histidine kinase [Lachnospiraceae bacterium]
MKRRHSILRTVVLRFIGYFLGIEIVISILEDLFSTLVYGAEREFPYDAIPGIAADMEPYKIAQIVLWGLLQMAVYCVGIALFARSISHKVSDPAGRMAEGFREVSNGNLDVSLDFETETEFKEMRDTFNHMTRNLKNYEEKRLTMENERMRLFSHIAHDLKTPMTTITGYAGALASGMVDDADKQREYHMAIKAKSDQMNAMVDQLLSYSKLGAPQYQMKLASADIAELLRVACASLFGEIESKQMKLDLLLPEEPVFFEMDSLEMSRAIGNLLTNAIRHNPEGSLLSVSLTEESEHIIIQIADSGAMIPDAIAGSLFEPFISGSDSRSSGSGTGLGLAIVKKVTEQHSGEVFVSDAIAPYTKMFVLRLPQNKKSGGRNV